MSARQWVPITLTNGVMLVILIAVLWRIENRIYVRQTALDEQLSRLKREVDTDTEVLGLAIQREYNDCFAVKKGE